MTKNVVFIATKPLQILISTAITKQLSEKYNFSLIVIDYFSCSKQVADNMIGAGWGWHNVMWAEDKNNAITYIKHLKPRVIFLDSDVGVKNLLFLASIKINSRFSEIYVYEEGHGTYRNDLYRGYKKRALRSLGVATHFGQSVLTSGIYVYEPERYLSSVCKYEKKCFLIKNKINDLIRDRDLDNIAAVFDPGSFFNLIVKRSQKCSIYLSSWKVDWRFLDGFDKKSGDNFVKLHPHIKKSEDFSFGSDIQLIPSMLPAEVVLMYFSQIYESVTVFHHSSGVSLYISDNESLKFEDLGTFHGI